MRKIILIAAMVLTSASAQAGGSRSLSLAANESAPVQEVTATTPATTNTVKMSETTPVSEAPKYVDRPPAISTSAPAAASIPSPAPAPAAAAAKPVAKTAKASRPRHKDHWTAGRIIGELHRHGIYW
jgi:hypothetical protein